mgnify:CR=1 FL=1
MKINKNTIKENIKTIFYALIIATIIRSLLVQPFYIPSSSMEPNLLIGDRLFVSKYTYGYSRHSFPFSPKILNKRIFNKKPERGDVVVFKTPSDNRTDYIKRLIGLPGDEIQFLECTSQETPFGYMGSFTDDREVLLLTEDGGKLARTTKYEQDENRVALEAAFKFDASGGLEGTITRASSGIFYANRMSLARLDQKDLSDYYYKAFDAINGLSVSNIQLNNDRMNVVYTESLDARATNYGSKVGGNFLLRLNAFALGRDAIPPKYAHRKSELIILRGTTQEDKIAITLPEGYEV